MVAPWSFPEKLREPLQLRFGLWTTCEANDAAKPNRAELHALAMRLRSAADAIEADCLRIGDLGTLCDGDVTAALWKSVK